KLTPYPPGGPGVRTPLDLWRYAGQGDNSWGTPNLPMPWGEWVTSMAEQKPLLMADVKAYMSERFDFGQRAIPGATRSGGNPILPGPIARLPHQVQSWEELSQMSAEEIRKTDIFPFKPLAHPLQTTAHMVFPATWVKAHPEHERIDLDHDIPESYLPEFPPPM